MLWIRSLLENESSTFSNLFLDLFADVLNRLKSYVCGLTTGCVFFLCRNPHIMVICHIEVIIHIVETSYIVGISHIVLYLSLLHSSPQVKAAIIFHFVTGCFKYYKWINKVNTASTGQSQGHQQALKQVHHQAINSVPPLTDWWVTTQHPLHWHTAPTSLACLSQTSCSRSHSTPTQLSCSGKAVVAAPSRGTVWIIFFCPLLEKFCPLFKHFAQMGSILPRQ